MSEKPEDLKKYSRSSLWHRYDDLVKDNRLIPIKKWFSDVKYEEIKEYLYQMVVVNDSINLAEGAVCFFRFLKPAQNFLVT